ncbi:MAG: ParB N-terminal domain-containing protein [candidate division KSB1 bacterium]|nr:ParB N-terminal domain-containing protein [candidate division KSB1 bacterium]
MQFEFKTIELEHINIQDTIFQLVDDKTNAHLTDSMASTGLTTPVWLQQLTNSYRIINGFQRIRSALKLGWQQIDSYIFPDTLTDLDVFKILLKEKGFTGLNPVESSAVIRKLESHFGLYQEQIIRSFFPLMKLANPRLYDLYYPLISLSPAWQSDISEGLVSLDAAAQVAEMEKRDQDSVHELFTRLKPGKNKQRQFLSLLTDVSRLENCSVHELIQSQEFETLFKQQPSNPSQLAAAVKEHLMCRRYPQYSKTEQQFRSLLQKAKCPPNLRIQHPPFFEGETFSVSFTFKSEQDYQQILQKLDSFLDNGLISDLKDLA